MEVIVVEEEGSEIPHAEAKNDAPRPLGLLRGRLKVPDDFNDPLPPDIQRYFDGEGDEE